MDWLVFRDPIVCCGRALTILQGGVSTAGGSVTLGLIADIYEAETQQFHLAFIVLSSCIGTSIGGIIGGPIGRCKSLLALWRNWKERMRR